MPSSPRHAAARNTIMSRKRRDQTPQDFAPTPDGKRLLPDFDQMRRNGDSLLIKRGDSKQDSSRSSMRVND